MRNRTIFLAIVLATALLGFAGCGGSGPSAPSVNDQLFVPNYVNSLDHLFHWDHVPMKVYFDLPANWDQMYPASTDLYVTAANEWNQPGQQQMIQIVSNRFDADATVQFVDKFNDPNSPDQAGVTDVTYNSATMALVTASVTIALKPLGDLDSAALVETDIAHELGHALGISGHSPNQTDLMYYAHGESDAVTVCVRDMNTVRTAYPSCFGKAWAQPTRSREPGELRRITLQHRRG